MNIFNNFQVNPKYVNQLSNIIKMAVNPEFLKTGYNDTYKPHIIIYLTTTSLPDSDVIYQSKIVKKSDKFRIITIAYQPTNNIIALENMSNCFFKALTENDLSALSSAIVSQIITASSTDIEYQC
ncbi:Hypothetical protein SRAE_X000096600 [Strongyloides ratti]|uniref:Uncharacterized protein n=1 Tax=Strongyloides ratti TaxID=34506 RepID=A0A090N114_STRRB|nr:Hypothetical protein SRAE_X000096600 [Strongyloides ratti]CEF71643.1 Hypothetical protein SRAE_X000096600 [Strongyloides ratti]